LRLVTGTLNVAPPSEQCYTTALVKGASPPDGSAMETSTTPENRRQSRGWKLGLALLLILVVGAAFRFYNVNWDKGTYHIHPDERHTTMVITRIEWPQSLGEYFDTSRSPLNPRNQDTVYFYGTLPLFLTKAVATQLDTCQAMYAETLADPAEYLATHAPFSSYDRVHLVGRVLSGLFDLGTVLLLFFLARPDGPEHPGLSLFRGGHLLDLFRRPDYLVHPRCG